MEPTMTRTLPMIAAVALSLAAGGGAAATERKAGEMSPMLEALTAPGPNAALAAKLRLYGRFVGSWTLDIDYYPPDGPVRRAEGEWHFDWVLDGKAIQDVWIFPARALRVGAKADEPWYFYGSTM